MQIMPGTRYLRLENSDKILPLTPAESCAFQGRDFKLGEEFNDNCTSLCVCQETGMKCLKMECPTYFGVDVLDPNCIEWETVPPHFVPSPPNCCPEEIRCKNNGSCLYKGETFPNWQQLPVNVTGCEQRCYCEMGNVECQNYCPPVTALPPNTLPCMPHQAVVGHSPDDDCCMAWVCKSGGKMWKSGTFTTSSRTEIVLVGRLMGCARAVLARQQELFRLENKWWGLTLTVHKLATIRTD